MVSLGMVLPSLKLLLMGENLVDVWKRLNTSKKTSWSKMRDEETYYDVEKAIDLAFKGKFVIDFYQYMVSKKILKSEVDEFIKSSTASEISDVVLELEEYIKGGTDNEHKIIREGYHHIPKPQARKIRNYLYKILEDAWRYSRDKRPGRRKKTSK